MQPSPSALVVDDHQAATTVATRRDEAVPQVLVRDLDMPDVLLADRAPAQVNPELIERLGLTLYPTPPLLSIPVPLSPPRHSDSVSSTGHMVGNGSDSTRPGSATVGSQGVTGPRDD